MHARFPALFVLVILLVSISPAAADPQVFGSFEHSADLSAIKASAGARTAISTRFPAWEGHSLEVVFPQAGGSIEYSKLPADWRWQESLLAFVWSMQPASITLNLRDSAGASFSRTFKLRAGVNHIQLPLSQLKELNRQAMRSLKLDTGQGGTFYLDYLALDRCHPVLDQRGRWDIDYSMEVETPHVPWARPLAGGPVRVFAIADVADGRGVVELAQRLQMDLRATTIGSSPGTNKWGFGDFYEHRSSGGEFWKNAYSLAHTYIADDLIHGPRYDVILWPGIRPWESYPPEVRDVIRKRVEGGTGLVLFYPFKSDPGKSGLWDPSPLVRMPDIKWEDSNNFIRNRFKEWDHSPWIPAHDHFITRGVPFGAFPFEQIAVPPSSANGQVLLKTAKGTPVLAVQTIGKGRVAAFGYSEKGMIPEIQNVFETGLHYPYHEHLWSLVARAVLWAAGRDTEPAIRATAPSTKGVLATVESAPPDARLLVTVRNDFGKLEASGAASPDKAGKGRVFSFVDPLHGGRHFVELRLLQGDKALDWATAILDVPVPVAIKSVVPELDRVRIGDDVPVRLKLTSTRQHKCLAIVRLLDNYDRLLDEQRLTFSLSGEGEQLFRLRTTGALTHLAKIDCEVSVEGRRSDRRIAEVFVLQPRKWDDYDIVMYRFGPDPIPGIWPTIDRQMRRLNVTTLSSYSVSHSKHANYNVQAQTRISGQESPDGPARDYYTAMKKKYLATGDKKVLVREYCLDDPAYRELITRQLKRLAEPWIPFSPMSYYVYEEPSLTCYGDAVDICFSPHTLTAMRKWLQEVYGGLERLNEQWGSRFADWESVVPDDTPEAQRRGNYSSWADHRTYMEKTYADTYAFVLEELRKLDPQGILLNSGTQVSGSHNGCDYSRMNQYTRHLNAYEGGNQLDFHRCFNPEIKISGGGGYGVLGKDVFYNFYDNLFKGANGGAYIFWQYSTLDPDLTMSQSGKDMEEGFRELRGEGIGKLVGLATPDNHGIAIHYSYPSIHGAWIVDGKVKEEVSYHTSPTFDRFNDNRDGWVKVLKDAGLQFDFIAYSDVEKGGLRSKGYRTFVLPMSVALSDAEAEAIREFVREGGTLIADALAGVMDQHCRFRQRRALLDVFGIDAPAGTRELIIAPAGEDKLTGTTARALGGDRTRPLMLANRFGNGRAYYLNHFLHAYPEDRREGRSAPALERMKVILKDAGIVPKVRIGSLGGESVAGFSSYLFNSGSTRLLGLIPDQRIPGTQKIRIAFDGTSAIYDVRRHRYVGNGIEFETEIEPAVPRLFAMVPSEIRGLDLSVPPSVRRGEEAGISFSVRGLSGLRSVAVITVTDPGGRPIAYYGGNVDIVAGKGSASFRTSLNDLAGVWRVAVRETISGVTRQAELHVQ